MCCPMFRNIKTLSIAATSGLALYVKERGQNEEAVIIYDWQVSAFNTLTGADQAVYNSLFTVKDEIPYIYDDINYFNEPGEKFRWPSLQDFQDYLLKVLQARSERRSRNHL